MTSADTMTAPDMTTPERLPVGQLMAFGIAGFLAIMTENLPAGLLPQISDSLSISQAMAGQTVTVYALGSVLAAVPIIAGTRHWNRRPLFLMAIAGLLVFNTFTALSAYWGLTLTSRFLAGMAAGVVWGLVAGYARRLSPPHLQGRALAIVGVGQPIALALGVPLGAFLADMSDWRIVFWMMSALALVLLVWIRVAIPDCPGQPKDRSIPVTQVFAIPGIRPVLIVLFAWILSHTVLYTYISPFVTATDTGLRVDIMLLVFGMAAIVGIWVAGMLVDRHLRRLAIVNLVGFAVAALLLVLASGSSVMVVTGVVVWGLTFGGAPTLLQTALADSAGEHADVAQSLFVTVFNSAIAAGSFVGGVAMDAMGAGHLPLVLFPMIAIALVATLGASGHGFPSRRV